MHLTRTRAAQVARACIWLLVAFSVGANAQSYPSRSIRMVVPFPPAGGTDTAARIVSVKVAELLAVPVVIDNRPGAGSMLGTDIVAKARPDGYTLLTVGEEFAINPTLQPKVPYDALRDFAPVSQAVSSQYVKLARSLSTRHTEPSAGE